MDSMDELGSVSLFISLAIRYILTSHSLLSPTKWSLDEIFAVTAAVSGGLLRIWAMRTLGRFFTFQVTIRDSHVLVETGPYQYLMHPSYTGLVMSLTGTFYFLTGGKGFEILGRQWLFWVLWLPSFLIPLGKRHILVFFFLLSFLNFSLVMFGSFEDTG